jgi:hypothetical protein
MFLCNLEGKSKICKAEIIRIPHRLDMDLYCLDENHNSFLVRKFPVRGVCCCMSALCPGAFRESVIRCQLY